jgi:hypothetical protein
MSSSRGPYAPALACVLLVITGARSVAAEAAAMPAPSGYLPLTVEGAGDGAYVIGEVEQPHAVRCAPGAPCHVALPPGRIRVTALETESAPAFDLVVDVRSVTKVVVEPGSKSRRTWGLVLGVTGIVVATVGAVGALGATLRGMSYDEQTTDRSEKEDRNLRQSVIFGGMFLGGLLMSVGGFVLRRTGATSMTVWRPPPRVALPIQLAGGVSSSGGFLAVSMSF